MFRWRRESPAGFAGWIGAEAVRVNQRGGFLYREGSSPEAVRRFFCLDADLPAIARQIDVDPVIHAALQEHGGLRVIRQDPWECMAAFILSAYNNIPRLTRMLETITRRFSPDAALPGNPDAGPAPFPGPEALAKAPERALRACGLGYRAPYVKAAAQAVATGAAPLEEWRSLEDEPLRRALLGLPGVGEKVVECVMLFAYGRAAAFPVDVWIGRAMRRWYFRGRKVTDRRMREFARKRFGPHCGWAQQYLYCHARKERI